jgi:hypothetical protein
VINNVIRFGMLMHAKMPPSGGIFLVASLLRNRYGLCFVPYFGCLETQVVTCIA